MNHKEKIKEFLSLKAIAVAGVSRDPHGKIGNAIFKKFKSCGYKVYPVNPGMMEFDGEKCFKSLKEIPVKIEGVYVATSVKNSYAVIKECAEAGIKRLWFHQGMGPANIDEAGLRLCGENNIDPITKGCPMMYLSPDIFHKCLKFIRRF